MSDHSVRGQLNPRSAEVYESFFVPALFAEWAPRVLEAASVEPGHRVVDVACGTGILARTAADRTTNPSDITGIDINDGMLAVARQKAPGITWVQGAAEDLPLENESVDRAVSQFGIMFYEDRAKALQEMLRVLKPGGRLAVAVWDRAENSPGYRTMIRLLEKLFGSEVADALRAPFNMGDMSMIESLCREAIPGEVTCRTLEGTARFASLDDWLHSDVKGWTLADMIDDDQFVELQKHAPDVLKAYVADDGSVAFPAPAHIFSAVK